MSRSLIAATLLVALLGGCAASVPAPATQARGLVASPMHDQPPMTTFSF